MRQLALLVLVLSSACSTAGPVPGGGGGTQVARSRAAQLDTDARAYLAGQEVELRLHNRSGEALFYNLCFSSLERHEEDGRWSVLPSDVLCTMEARRLAPSATATERRALSADLPAGTYRFSTRVERETSPSETASSAPFHVGAPGEEGREACEDAVCGGT